ncbi:hypothetical protein BS329_12285 [Amycolatopsis coloradensis]|uniref:Uncharacterized protein n=1 Tax=Amycolatopsis coloradensis TaxID=76021 RepID=A0A1R0KX06_9PSEU|nr:hypothetical protein [Amycolatopsis coloradensis]OLZ53545.1 hypothetical protein BS329_12285 [Amycolatopsis coloradensis]
MRDPQFGVGWLLILLPATATLVLALLPQTARWPAAEKQPAMAMPPQNSGYPPAPGPQQGPPPGQW